MMNKFKSNILSFVVSLSTALNASAADQTVLTEANDVTGRIVLAELIFPNGNKMIFGQLSKSDEMYVEEHVELGDDELFILDHLQGTLLEKYLDVTPPGTPVPHQLIDFEQENATDEVVLIEKEGQSNEGNFFVKGAEDEVLLYEQGFLEKRMRSLAGRKLVNSVAEEVYVDWAELDQNLVTSFNKAAGQGSCNNSTGYQFFIDHHCFLSGNHGSGGSQTHCDYPMHSGIQRTSSDRMRSTFSRVVNCGPGDAAIVHSKKTGGFWYEQATWFMGVNQARGVETWAGKYSLRKNRRVNVLKVTPGGYVRAWTKFTRNSK